MQLLAQGAEAKIYDNGEEIVKTRLSKGYRISEIDEKIIKARIKKETKILLKLQKLKIKAPRYIKTEGNSLFMEKIKGRTAKECINDDGILYKIGILVSELHNANIIHGDLTTLNFIVNKEVYVIDFGLSYTSTKNEDKAVDLYVFEKALRCGHSVVHIEKFYEGYSIKGSPAVLERLEDVRLRGRKREESVM